MALLDRDRILNALRALDEELGQVGVRGEVFSLEEQLWRLLTTLGARRSISTLSSRPALR
jgi:hypothetical protein